MAPGECFESGSITICCPACEQRVRHEVQLLLCGGRNRRWTSHVSAFQVVWVRL